MKKENLMEGKPIKGMLVDLEDLKKTPTLVLWGRCVRSDGFISPHVKLLEVHLARNLELTEKNGLLSDTYFTFE